MSFTHFLKVVQFYAKNGFSARKLLDAGINVRAKITAVYMPHSRWPTSHTCSTLLMQLNGMHQIVVVLLYSTYVSTNCSQLALKVHWDITKGCYPLDVLGAPSRG